MSRSESVGGGVSFLGLLTLVFITLKLCSVINWSWWWVLAPLWIPSVIYILIICCVCAFLVGIALIGIIAGSK